MILRVWEPIGFKCGLIQVLRWRHLGPVSHSIFPHPAPQRLCSLPGLPVAARAHIPPGSVQQKKMLSVGTLTQIPGLTWTGEAWATCLLLASSCGREGIQDAHWQVWVRHARLELGVGSSESRWSENGGWKSELLPEDRERGHQAANIQPVFTPSLDPLVVLFRPL